MGVVLELNLCLNIEIFCKVESRVCV